MAGEDVEVGDLVAADGVTLSPVYLWGVVLPDGVSVDVMAAAEVAPDDGTTPPPPPPPEDGNPAITYGTFANPFAPTAPFNTAVSTTAAYESSTDPTTKKLLDNVLKGTVNDEGSGYSVGIANVATGDTSAPVVTVRHPSDGSAKAGTVYVPASAGFRIPASFRPPTPPGGEMGDRNSVIVNGGRYGYDFYRLVKVSDTEWTSTSVDAIDLASSGIIRGVRAANISLLNGLIRQHEVDAVLSGERDDFGHALAISADETILGPPPPDPGYQWPANQRDSSWITYSGLVRLGMLFAIPPGINPAGSASHLLAKALLNTLVRYGVYVVDRSSTVALYLEHGVSSSLKDVLRAAWRDLGIPRLRLVTSNTSSTPGGGPAPRLA